MLCSTTTMRIAKRKMDASVYRSTAVYYIGSPADDVLDCERICIVTATNAVTCKSYGITRTLATKYPYGDVVGTRYTDIGRNYACSRDRGVVGSVLQSRSSTRSDKPVIVTMITQYGIGGSIEDNAYAQKAAMYSKDGEHADSLRKDTHQDRVAAFTNCLDGLRNLLLSPEFTDVDFLVVPFGIG